MKKKLVLKKEIFTKLTNATLIIVKGGQMRPCPTTSEFVGCFQ